ncbi:COMM domain-containing protein 3-like [Tubulanus polymorphus]|uniref:COMM domain-containing protein 3-like n=1 Tax=Tubulanus polymorphus TaxID=672921 RepID=UPI003DA6876C
MEFSSEVLENLSIAGDSAHVPDKCFRRLIVKLGETILNSSSPPDISGDTGLGEIDAAVRKQVVHGLLTLILESVKHDANESNISPILEDCKFTQQRIEIFNELYVKMKDDVRAELSNIGNNPAHIVDVDWRLDFYIKNNYMEKVCRPTYLINLKTEQCGNSEQSNYQFECSLEQLQDMVGKLKEATKTIEKAAAQS